MDSVQQPCRIVQQHGGMIKQHGGMMEELCGMIELVAKLQLGNAVKEAPASLLMQVERKVRRSPR
jgi:hypothetical protein